MPFIFLLLFGLICLQGQTHWPGHPGWLTPAGCAILAGTMTMTSWLLADLLARAAAWQLRRQPDLRTQHLQRYARWRRLHFIGLLVSYMGILYGLGWGDVLKQFWLELQQGVLPNIAYEELPDQLERQRIILPGFEIVLMAPFFIGLLLAWERFYRVEKTAYELGHSERFISRWSYLLLQVRHQLLLVMPPMLLLLLNQSLILLFPDWNEKSYLTAILATGLMIVTILLMPLLLRVFLGLKPLPPGPLRDRLEQTAKRLHFRYANILLWNTRNLFANALVTGFIPWVRYIVLTDRLIDELSPEEIEAVFGHEIGHIKHHHLLLYMTFFLTSFILLGLFWETVKDWLRQDEIKDYIGEYIWGTMKTFSSFGKLGLLAVYTLLVFGFISRRCEREADLFGSHTVSIETFINALEKVAAINGIPRDRAGNWLLSWQHPTIAQRVEFLETMRDNPALIPQFHRSVALLRWAFFLLLACLVWGFGLVRVWELLAEF